MSGVQRYVNFFYADLILSGACQPFATMTSMRRKSNQGKHTLGQGNKQGRKGSNVFRKQKSQKMKEHKCQYFAMALRTTSKNSNREGLQKPSRTMVIWVIS